MSDNLGLCQLHAEAGGRSLGGGPLLSKNVRRCLHQASASARLRSIRKVEPWTATEGIVHATFAGKRGVVPGDGCLRVVRLFDGKAVGGSFL